MRQKERERERERGKERGRGCEAAVARGEWLD